MGLSMSTAAFTVKVKIKSIEEYILHFWECHLEHLKAFLLFLFFLKGGGRKK